MAQDPMSLHQDNGTACENGVLRRLFKAEGWLSTQDARRLDAGLAKLTGPRTEGEGEGEGQTQCLGKPGALHTDGGDKPDT